MVSRIKISIFCYVLLLISYISTCCDIYDCSKDSLMFDFGYNEIWRSLNFVMMASVVYCKDKYGVLLIDNPKQYALNSYYSTMMIVAIVGLLTAGIWIYLGYDIAIILCILAVYALLFNLITTVLALMCSNEAIYEKKR